MESVCPVSADVRHPVSSPSSAVAGLIAVYEASREALGGRLALNLPALNVSVGEMLDALEQVAGPAVRARVRFERDERIAGIVANWPTGATAARAAALGLKPDLRFTDIVRQYIDDCRQRARCRHHAERTELMNQIDLKGRVAVITGGAQGIGYAAAERMLKSGAERRAVGHRRRASWPRPRRRWRPRAWSAAWRSNSPTRPRWPRPRRPRWRGTATSTSWSTTPASPAATAPPGNSTRPVWRRVIEVNLIGPYLTCRAVVPHMIERGYGRIVNIASVAGKEGNPNASHYSASKAALIALTKSLAKELATKGVMVNAITPAAAKTAMFATMAQSHIDFMLSKIPMGALPRGPRGRGDDRLAGLGRLLLQHRRGLRPVRRARHLLTPRRPAGRTDKRP